MSDETMTTPADAALLREMAEGEVYEYTLGIDVPAYDEHTRARLRALADVLDTFTRADVRDLQEIARNGDWYGVTDVARVANKLAALLSLPPDA